VPHDPKDYPQTHDFLGREFTTPEPGGTVPAKLNLLVGVAKANSQTIIGLVHGDNSIDLFVGGYDEQGNPNEVGQEEIEEILAPLIERLEPYEGNAAYYDSYSTFVGDLSFEEGKAEVERLLAEAGLEYESV
jgi:hypothetical protein